MSAAAASASASTNSYMPFLEQVVNKLHEMFPDTDPETYTILVTNVFQFLGPLMDKELAKAPKPTLSILAAPAKRSGATSGSGSATKKSTAYQSLKQLLTKHPDEMAAIGPVTITKPGTNPLIKYSEKALESLTLLAANPSSDDTLFIEHPTIADAFKAVAGAGFSGYGINAIVWHNMSTAQQSAASALLDGPVNNAVGAPITVPVTRTATKTTGSGNGKRGHNAIKTVIAIALKNETLKEKLTSWFNDHLSSMGKEPMSATGLNIGVKFWSALDSSSQDEWNRLCSELSADATERKREITANPEFIELLARQVDAFLGM